VASATPFYWLVFDRIFSAESLLRSLLNPCHLPAGLNARSLYTLLVFLCTRFSLTRMVPFRAHFLR
jgi:hypothetical protein